MENTNGMEKRKYMRMTFPTAGRPIFRSRGQKFTIKDLSRGGLRFCGQDNIKIRGWVNGRMDLADGTSIKVEGIVVRVNNHDMGLSFIGALKDDVYRKITTTIRFAS